MAHRPRIYVPGVAHHVIQRGNNREASLVMNLTTKPI
jgi:REP element-mobilizing transposase RayT